MQWSDLLAAFALYLVLEGIMPFLNPPFMKRVMQSFTESTERQLRIGGFVSMMAGLVLLYFIRAEPPDPYEQERSCHRRAVGRRRQGQDRRSVD